MSELDRFRGDSAFFYRYKDLSANKAEFVKKVSREEYIKLMDVVHHDRKALVNFKKTTELSPDEKKSINKTITNFLSMIDAFDSFRSDYGLKPSKSHV